MLQSLVSVILSIFTGEQRGASFKNYLSTSKVQVEYTSPEDSAANGVAERAIEIIESGTNTLRVHAGLPTEAWAELYEATCVLENCLPTSANPQKKSAKEMGYGGPTDVSLLRTIGSPCVVYTLPRHRLLKRIEV